jgi:predicted acetyltransferase
MSTKSGLELRLPRLDEEQEFLAAHRATSPEVPSFLHFYEEGMPFARYLDRLRAYAADEHLTANLVPATFRFAFLGPRIVGRISIRHRLNAFLEREGGHIGYAVVPEFRRRGYATEMLGWAVEFGRTTLGLDRLLVTCDDDNVGSIRTIEKNGGVFEDIVVARGKALRRYWIDARG